MPTLTQRWTVGGRPVLDPRRVKLHLQQTNRASKLSAFWGKANSVRYSRGMRPVRAWVLVAADTARALSVPGAGADLMIDDGYRKVTFTGLTVVRVVGISPGVTATSIYDAPDDSIYMLCLTDQRYYARDTAYRKLVYVGGGENSPPTQIPIHGNAFRFRDADNTLTAGGSFTTLLGDIWTNALERRLGPLTFDSDTNTLGALIPEGYRLDGDNPWESVESILRDLNWSLIPDVTMNSRVMDPKNPRYDVTIGSRFKVVGPGTPTVLPPATDDWLYNVATAQYLADTDTYVARDRVPENWQVFFPSRDYQFELGIVRYHAIQDETPGDYWTKYPYHVREVKVLPDWVSGESSIESGQWRILWATLPYRTDDTKAPLNAQELQAHATALVQREAASIEAFNRSRTFTFHGCWPLTIGLFFSGMVIFDVGDKEGLRTKVYQTPGDLNLPTSDLSTFDPSELEALTPPREYPGVPDVGRQTAPITRDVYGYLISEEEQRKDCTIRKPDDPPPSAGALPPDRRDMVIVLAASNATADPVRWRGVSLIYAINSTDNPIPYYKRVMVKYNYQAGVGGQWYIVSVHRETPDWQQMCISQLELEETACRRDVNLISVRRDSSLRLCQRGDSATQWGPGTKWDESTIETEVILDIAPGDIGNQLFQSHGSNTPPRWTHEPKSSGPMKCGNWLKIRNDPNFTTPYSQPTAPPAANETWIGTKPGHLKILLPSTAPGTQAYLIAQGVSSQCVDLGWRPTGIDCSIDYQNAAGNPCNLLIQGGLIVAASCHPGCTWANGNSNPICQAMTTDDYDPCGAYGPGEPGPEPPPPQEPPESFLPWHQPLPPDTGGGGNTPP